MYFCNAKFSISCYYVLHLWLCQDGRGRVSWRVSGEGVLRGWRQSSNSVGTGLEEDWTMTLIEGPGTVNGSAWEALVLAVPLLRLPLFLGHTEHTTLYVKKVGQSPLQAWLPVQSTGSLTWKSLQEVPENGKLCVAGLVSVLHAELCGSLEASALCVFVGVSANADALITQLDFLVEITFHLLLRGSLL